MMSRPDFDLVVAGGGLAGSALAQAMAKAGHRVLVVEKEMHFRDRIRGEVIMPWGVVEAQELGVLDRLISHCSHEAPTFNAYRNGVGPAVRDLKSTTPRATCCVTFSHPVMQESLLDLANEAGAEVWRGAVVDSLDAGPTPQIVVSMESGQRTIQARLIVLADGRDSRLRAQAGFTANRDPLNLLTAGMALEGEIPMPEGVHLFVRSDDGKMVILIRTGDRLYRIYLVYHHEVLPRRLSGGRDVATAFEEFNAIGVPKVWLAGARQVGPFATFDGAFTWVDSPHREGIVLLGDSAGASDPAWGNGLSRTLRDVRLLRDRLTATDDWELAGARYANDHDEHFNNLHRLENMQAELLFARGKAATDRRRRMFALFEDEPDREPDSIGLGPDAPCDETARARYLGEQD